jgi:hypothetical protein
MASYSNEERTCRIHSRERDISRTRLLSPDEDDEADAALPTSTAAFAAEFPFRSARSLSGLRHLMLDMMPEGRQTSLPSATISEPSPNEKPDKIVTR